jgi:TonB family protein
MRSPFVLAFIVAATSVLAESPKITRGVTAEGRTVFAHYRTSPPWMADVISRPRAELSAAESAKKQGGEGLFRVLLYVGNGHVYRVVVERSTGYPALDESLVRYFRGWQLKPYRWKEFEMYAGLYTRP